MISDLVINSGSCHLQSKPPNSENGACRKKRVNRSAKLKQCKLDARREQWLSQVKNKGSKEGHVGFPRSASLNLGNLETRSSRSSGGEENEDGDGSLGNVQDSDLESPINSPGSSVMGRSVDGVGSRPERPGSSSSSGSCSASMSGGDDGEEHQHGEEQEHQHGEEDDDGILDDWEAVADALNIKDRPKPTIEPSPTTNGGNVQGVFKPDYKGKSGNVEGNRTVRTVTCRAWRPDDASRPLSLPNLSKQRSFPERNCGHGGDWIQSQPPSSTCPICYEELDLTDSIFLPCSCGFRLCLFCHKRILEADGRCPGCRKQYTEGGTANGGACVEPVLGFQRLSRSSSVTMNATSF